MKIVTRQITNKDVINKSRHLTGLHRWSRSSKIVGFLMLVVEWFIIPFEVVFRHDFGQRWLTAVNFFAGALLIWLFWSLQYEWHYVRSFFATGLHWFQHLTGPDQNPPEDSDAVSDQLSWVALGILFYCYLLLGSYQLFKIKWRNQVQLALHSFDDGTSRFRWLGAIIRWVINGLATPFMILFWLMVPRKQRKGKPFPHLIHDYDIFTNLCVEPGMAILLGLLFTSVASFYFFCSGIALFLHAHWKEMARKSKLLDFEDSKIEAEMMKELRNAQNRTDEIVLKAKAKLSEKNVKIDMQPFGGYPALSIIIDEMNNEKNGLSG